MATRDRRLLERDLRKGIGSEPDPSELLDVSDNAEFPSDDSVEQLAAELESEKVVRDLRVEKSLLEPPPSIVPIAPPAVPFDVE